MLELRSANGTIIQSNDDWGQSPRFPEVNGAGLAPGDAREAAIMVEVSPGNYSAILRGTSNGTGVALLEIYNLR